jgi:ribosomal protein L22
MKKVLGEEDDLTLATLNILSLALSGQGKWAAAEDILSELITKSTTIRGKHHPHTLASQYNLTFCLVEKESFDEAAQILEEVVKAQERILGKQHPNTINSRNQLEYVIRQQKFPRSTNRQPPRSPSNGQSSPEPTRKSVRSNDQAAQILEETVETREKILGKEHTDTIDSRTQLERVRSTNSQPPRSPSNGQSSPEPTRQPVRINRLSGPGSVRNATN